MKRPKTYLFLLACLALGTASAQNDLCMAQLKSVYKKYGDITSAGIPSDKVFYMSYTTNTLTEDSLETGVISSSVETWMSKENLEVRSKEMEVYQNSKEVFIILPVKKLVVHNDAVAMDKKKTDNKLKRMQFIQDTLFSMSRVASCTAIKASGGTFKRVVLKVNEKGKAMTAIDHITFDIDPVTQTLSRIKIVYAPKSKGLPGDVVSLEYVFHEVSFDYQGKQWTGNLSKKFLKSSDKVNDQYKGYSLVDNRVKKNKPEGTTWK